MNPAVKVAHKIILTIKMFNSYGLINQLIVNVNKTKKKVLNKAERGEHESAKRCFASKI